MKIYTRTGDTGTTALFGGDRVAKSHARIDAYGTVDEANSFIGLARAHLGGAGRADEVLARVQDDLFVVGADLATPADARPSVPRVDASTVAWMESTIDALEADLPALTQFILPGGTPAAAALHVSRTVVRRAERLTVEARRAEGGDGTAFAAPLTYLNRLSDLLFVLARWVNVRAGAPEVAWTPPDQRGSGA